MNDITLDYDLLERQARLLVRTTDRLAGKQITRKDAEQLYAVWELLIRLIEDRPFPEAKDR